MEHYVKHVNRNESPSYGRPLNRKKDGTNINNTKFKMLLSLCGHLYCDCLGHVYLCCGHLCCGCLCHGFLSHGCLCCSCLCCGCLGCGCFNFCCLYRCLGSCDHHHIYHPTISFNKKSMG